MEERLNLQVHVHIEERRKSDNTQTIRRGHVLETLINMSKELSTFYKFLTHQTIRQDWCISPEL